MGLSHRLSPDVVSSCVVQVTVAMVGRWWLSRPVNREPGSEARSVLDRELAGLGIDARQLPGYGTRATGHLQVAAAIAAGLADAGVASEPAAIAYGLGFIPLASERFDLVIPAGVAGSREV
jgi:putative molybdopterin biosynthesis protein